jgi:hypothetical protein
MDEGCDEVTDSSNPTPTRAVAAACGGAAMLGGILLILAAGLHALEPVGCIGAECEFRPMRPTSTLTAVLAAAAGVLVLVGLGGLAFLPSRTGRGKVLARTGFVCAVAGFAVLTLATVVQAAFFGGDLPWMPFVVLPGVVALLAGVVLIAISAFISGILPRWVAILLAASGVLALGMNGENAAVLLIVPLGVAVTLAGAHICSPGRRSASPPRALPEHAVPGP